jgi:hypothetical protein
MTTNLATKIADLLFLEDSTVKNLVRKESQADIRRDVSAWLGAYERSLRNHLRNAEPNVPAGDTEQRPYPDIAHPKLPVPDPAETETSEPSKPSTPDYLDMGDALETMREARETLFDEQAGADEKVESIKVAKRALDDYLSILRKF